MVAGLRNAGYRAQLATKLAKQLYSMWLKAQLNMALKRSAPTHLALRTGVAHPKK